LGVDIKVLKNGFVEESITFTKIEAFHAKLSPKMVFFRENVLRALEKSFKFLKQKI
jgi:hypothetical protein